MAGGKNKKAGPRGGKPARPRLEEYLVQHGYFADTREARSHIIQGHVLIGDQPETRPGWRISAALEKGQLAVRLRGIRSHVARSGGKLAGFFANLPEAANRVRAALCWDVGCSHGGFTQELLRQGAGRVLALDVSPPILDYQLQRDPRVDYFPGQDIQRIFSRPEGKPSPPLEEARRLCQTEGLALGVIVSDISFLPLSRYLPHLLSLQFWPALGSGPTENSHWKNLGAGFSPVDYFLLIKPQFELPVRQLDAGQGIATSFQRNRVLRRIRLSLARLGHSFWVVPGQTGGGPLSVEIRALTPSTVAGRKGNQEYFLWFRVSGHPLTRRNLHESIKRGAQ